MISGDMTMTIASRYEKAAKLHDKNDVHGFRNEVEFSASEKYMNAEKGYMEYLFKDKSVLAVPFNANRREDGEIKSIVFNSLDNVREIQSEGWN
jgi:hypothetical protein